MKRTAKRWMAWGACWLGAALAAWGAMGGVSREGDWAVEIYANGKEVERTGTTWKVGVPKDLEDVLAAAGAKAGTPVRLAEWGRDGTLVKAERRWFSLELTIKVPAATGAPKAVEHFQMVPWAEFSGDIRQALLDLPKGEAAAFGTGLGSVLDRMQAVFGGAVLAEAFPKTAYAKEFAKAKKYADAVVRAGIVRGWAVPRRTKERYEALFGEEWPKAAVGLFWAAGGEGVWLKGARLADGTAVEDAFSRPLPVKIDGEGALTGVFPAGKAVRLRFGAGEGLHDGDRVIEWPFGGEGSVTWFALHGGTEGATSDFSARVENAGSVPVRASVETGGRTIESGIPAGGSVALCLVLPEGAKPQVRAVADTEHPDDYEVTPRPEGGTVVVEGVRKAYPELVLNNPEIMPVDVEISAEGAGGRREAVASARLKAGELGYAVAVPPHKALEVRCRFKSEFHKESRVPAGPIGYGGRADLVLRAERKGDPEVVLFNAGTVAVSVEGITGPKARVTVAPGKRETVTVASGKRATLVFAAADADWTAAPLVLPAMAPGERRNAAVKAVPKAAPQAVLDNSGGMMDVEATLVSASGVALGRPVKVKRGKKSLPIPLPAKGKASFRLVYSHDGFTATGTLAVPEVPRGETKTLAVPGPSRVKSGAAPSGGAAKGGGFRF